jgi:peptidoglycan hydrolase-like protein with peptidoglycan-binding domain
MGKLILATASALALGMAGAGHAAEPVSPNPMPEGVQATPGARTQSEHGAQAENWSKSRIEQVQRRLKAAGAYDGPIDGKLGARTQQAISTFQQEHGLPQTGNLDQKTQAALANPSNGSGSSATPGAQPGNAGLNGANGASPPQSGTSGNGNGMAAPGGRSR